MSQFFQSRLVGSLEKVFCRGSLDAEPVCGMAAARGEVAAFQVACRAEGNIWLSVKVESDLSSRVSVREVGLVPCELPAMPDDPHILSCEPGLYPDPLLPMDGLVRLSCRNWHALWVSVDVTEDLPAGPHVITIRLSNFNVQHPECADFERVEKFTLEVLPFSLPGQELIHTQWFHADCVHTHYKTECWGERHWHLLEKYFRNMAGHGVNTLLTPLWTPPLDTAVGHERPTTQLLDIELRGGEFKFDFGRLLRWTRLAEDCGIKYFEMSHAFTQWGAGFTPKIMVRENGAERRMFGWHVAADSPAYSDFLTRLMPELVAVLKGAGLSGRCFFHVSDEPVAAHMESYGRAAALLGPLAGDFPVIDALSDVAFFRSGLVKCPIPSTEHLDEFMGEDIARRWVYYCGNYDRVPNRQFGMPSARNRVMGVLLYLYNLEGFLNWGFNFWHSQFSLRHGIDPYKVTDAGRAFCGGGSFMVYPGEDGPVDSLHYEVFREGLQDLRALRLLERMIGRDAVVRLAHEGLDYRMSMRRYPREASWLTGLRERVNRRICESMDEQGLK